MAADVLGNGWNISEQGLVLITANQTITNKSQILKNALNADLKEIGSPTLLKLSNKTNVSQVVLQIQKIRNISAPKANEKSQAAPRMLKLVLTDGDGYIQAIETAPISTINPDKTAPGTKILIKSAKLSLGYLLLDSNNCSILGGEVPALYEKWQLAKSVQFHSRQQNSSSDGPPAWVNFGGKIQSDPQDKQFKSLVDKNEAKENTKFDQARQDAIAEANSGAVKKVFGGGSKQPVQQSIKVNRKPPERRNQKNKNIVENELEEKPQKPSERVSLFDFLEDKLPVETEPTKPPPVSNNYSSNSYNYKNNQTNNNVRKTPFNNNPRTDYNNPRTDYKNAPRNDYNNTSRADYNNTLRTEYKNTPRTEYKSNPRTEYKNNPRTEYNNTPRSDYNNTSRTDYNNTPRNEYNNTPRTDYNNTPRTDYNNAPRTDYSNTARTDYNNTKQATRIETNQNEKHNLEINGLNSSFAKMALNSQFASRTLRQHLNLGPQKKNEEVEVSNAQGEWKIGDECMAKYWEDRKFYNAIITAITDKTFAVKFKGYGNIEEVLKSDCLPLANRDASKKPFVGQTEFRRNTRTFRRQ